MPRGDMLLKLPQAGRRVRIPRNHRKRLVRKLGSPLGPEAKTLSMILNRLSSHHLVRPQIQSVTQVGVCAPVDTVTATVHARKSGSTPINFAVPIGVGQQGHLVNTLMSQPTQSWIPHPRCSQRTEMTLGVC